jgi:hypothetical protein
MKKLTGTAIILFFFLSVVNAEESINYTNETFARLSYINGNVYVQRATELDYEEGIINMPITEGDRMGTTDGRAEIYLGRGKFLRLDYNTKIDLLNLPRREDDLTRIQAWTGCIYFSIQSLKREKCIEIHTSGVSLYILEDGLYRVDIRGDETEIFVFRGLIEAAGEAGSVLIKEAQRLEAVRGHFLGHPSGFAAVAEDSFDRWSQQRDYEVRQHMARRYLGAELEDFEYELAAYGEWIHIQPFGYVWVPGGIDPYWRPYWHGRWLWFPACGWTWLPYESWGWVTFHFGRWHWSAAVGWYWIPTSIWGPAWVHWHWGYDYVGWAPLSYWGYPGVVINNTYYGQHTGEYYPYRSRALTVVHKNQLSARTVSKVALSQEAVKDIGQIRMAKNQPAIQPVSGRISVESLSGGNSRFQKSTGTSEAREVSKTDLSKKIQIDGSREAKSLEKRNIPTRKEYPSSTTIPRKKAEEVKRSKPSLGSLFDFISGSKSKITRSQSSSSSSSKGVKSSTRSGSSSSVSKSSSSSRSSSKSRSSSGKVKKKK